MNRRNLLRTMLALPVVAVAAPVIVVEAKATADIEMSDARLREQVRIYDQLGSASMSAVNFGASFS